MDITTYPLHSITVEEAKQLQFRVIDIITRHFSGYEILSLGDVGLVPGLNKPLYTKKAEAVFAEVFAAEAAVFVRGAGTGALRWAFAATVLPGDNILVHEAPIYPTTKVTMETMGLTPVMTDFNNVESIRAVCAANKSNIKGVLIQHTRQKIDDSYNFLEVIALVKEALPDIPVITDDNYAALKVSKIGAQAGADLSTFSCFKILGPEGIGVILGKKKYVDMVYKYQYSGGSQVQGHEAMAALRGLVYAPVSLAIQSEVGEELVKRLNAGEVSGVRAAFLANAQSKVLLVEFKEDIAEAILEITPKLGAAAYPVGSESIYEFVPMIYRVSGTFRARDPALEKRMIRINPMRCGADTIIRILRKAIEVLQCKD